MWIHHEMGVGSKPVSLSPRGYTPKEHKTKKTTKDISAAQWLLILLFLLVSFVLFGGIVNVTFPTNPTQQTVHDRVVKLFK